jgi:hypothetical protein
MQSLSKETEDYASALRELGRALQARFQRTNNHADIERALSHQRSLLDEPWRDQYDRHIWLSDAAFSLQFGTSQTSSSMKDDLLSPVCMSREALALCPPGSPERDDIMFTLACALLASWYASGNAQFLQESIDIHTTCLALRGPNHPLRGQSLGALSAAKRTLFTQSGDDQHVLEAERLCREAVQCYPQGHCRSSGKAAPLNKQIKINPTY